MGRTLIQSGGNSQWQVRIYHIEPHDPEISVEGYDNDTIAYHLFLIKDAGLVDSGNVNPMVGIGYRGFT